MRGFKSGLSVLIALAGIALYGNEIKNSDFNKIISDEIKLVGNPNLLKLSPYTEDLTWNKCAKLELVKYHVDADGMKSYGGGGGGVIIGGENGLFGFPVEPDSTYKFSLDLKGTMYRVFVKGAGWSGGDNDQMGLESTLGCVKVQKDWVTYRGTFKTKAATTRAALHIQFWGHEKYKDMPDKEGSYLLIDNVNIEKAADSFSGSLNNPAVAVKPVDPKKAVIATGAGKVPALDGKLDDEAWRNASKINNFYFYENTTPAATPTEARVIAGEDALWLGITCAEPEMGALKASCSGSGDGGAAIWKDDEIEIFFGAVKPGRTLNQFVVSAGGGRWMGWGGQQSQPTEKDYQPWEVKTAKGDNCWTVEVKIPYSTIELPKRPEKGFAIPFNIARQRKAGGGELSSWNAVKGNFHNTEYYGVLAFDTLCDDLKKRVDDIKKSFALIKDVSSADREKLDEVSGVIAKWEKSLSSEPTAAAWAEAYVALERVKTAIKFLRLSKLTFAVTAVSPYKTDFTVPVLPEDISADDVKISCRAAVNEFKGVPILITNLGEVTQEYRVFLYSELVVGIEEQGLKGFPSDKITVRQGVRVKDSDGTEHGQRFDPLVGMNEAMTIVVPPKDSGLVWITFDCGDVKPGTYEGFIRVIPLNESAKFDFLPAGWTYKGSMRDISFALDVLPIDLSREPVASLWLMRDAANEKFFKDMIEHDNRVFQFSPDNFMFEFSPDGSIAKAGDSVSKFKERVTQHLEWSKKYKIHPQFLLGLDSYMVFEEYQMAPAKIGYGTAEWKNAWKNWVLEVDKAFKELGVAYKDYCVEVWDEPGVSATDKVMETCRLAKEVTPSMRLQITFGASGHTDADMIKMIPYVDNWCFWGSYYDDPGFQVILNKLKAADKAIRMYFCNSELNSSLYKYYRMHAWKGRLYENPVLGLFRYMTGPGGFYGSGCWKGVAAGSLVYNSFSTPVISIRYECLREGFTDIKYLKKLEEVAAKAKAAGVADALVKEAEALSASASYEVVEKYNYDAGTADKVRDKAIVLILKMQKEMK